MKFMWSWEGPFDWFWCGPKKGHSFCFQSLLSRQKILKWVFVTLNEPGRWWSRQCSWCCRWCFPLSSGRPLVYAVRLVLNSSGYPSRRSSLIRLLWTFWWRWKRRKEQRRSSSNEEKSITKFQRCRTSLEGRVLWIGKRSKRISLQKSDLLQDLFEVSEERSSPDSFTWEIRTRPFLEIVKKWVQCCWRENKKMPIW